MLTTILFLLYLVILRDNPALPFRDRDVTARDQAPQPDRASRRGDLSYCLFLPSTLFSPLRHLKGSIAYPLSPRHFDLLLLFTSSQFQDGS
jgi:hypothetical protein